LSIVTHNSSSTDQPAKSSQMLDSASIISLILWFLVILYSTFTSASKGSQLIGSSKERTSLNDNERKCDFY